MKKLIATLLTMALLAGMTTAIYAEEYRKFYFADQPLEVEEEEAEVQDEEEEEPTEIEQPSNINSNPGTGR